MTTAAEAAVDATLWLAGAGAIAARLDDSDARVRECAVAILFRLHAAAALPDELCDPAAEALRALETDGDR